MLLELINKDEFLNMVVFLRVEKVTWQALKGMKT
jgi:hypothetical protein